MSDLEGEEFYNEEFENNWNANEESFEWKPDPWENIIH